MNVWTAPENSSPLKSNLSKSNYSLLYLCFFYSLAEELLAKESIGLPDILRVLGDRPFPMKESVREYLQELTERKEKQDQKEADDAAKTAEPESEAAAETPDASKSTTTTKEEEGDQNEKK